MGDGQHPWQSDYERRPGGFPIHRQRGFRPRGRGRPPLAARLRRGRTLAAAEIATPAVVAAVAAVAVAAAAAAAAMVVAEVMEAPARLRGGGVPQMGAAWGGMKRRRPR